MYYTYILVSKDGRRTYTGVTSDLKRRFEEHNRGKVKSSKPYRPYEVLHYDCYETLAEATSRERFFKSTQGRRKLKLIININNFLKD